MQYAITRDETLTLMKALKLPPGLRNNFIGANIYLSIAIGVQTVYRLNTAMFTTVPDLVLIEMYIGLKRFCAAYAKQEKIDPLGLLKLAQMTERFYVGFMDTLEIYLKEGV